jgi:hypothetical protein
MRRYNTKLLAAVGRIFGWGCVRPDIREGVRRRLRALRSSRRRAISSARWAETLGAEIAARKTAPDDRETYYRAALAALERLLAENGNVTRAELDEREQQWERAYLRTPHGRPVELRAGEALERSVDQ